MDSPYPIPPARQGGDLLFEIACTFPVLQHKGVREGSIPGIRPAGFRPQSVARHIYHGEGRAWSPATILVMEFLLNLTSPCEHNRFNLARALSSWDRGQMGAFLAAVQEIYRTGTW